MKFNITNFEFSIVCDDFSSQIDLSEIPPIQRRRLGNCAKMLFNITKNYGEIPMIFSSKFGEINQNFEISYNLAFENFISPTMFSLSVLNASLALKAIKSKNSCELLAISSNLDIENGLILAISKLQMYDKIAVICYDEKINQSYFKENNFKIAVSFIIEKGDKNEINFGFDSKNLKENSEINFILNDKKNYEISNGNLRFTYKFSDEFLQILKQKKIEIFGDLNPNFFKKYE